MRFLFMDDGYEGKPRGRVNHAVGNSCKNERLVALNFHTKLLYLTAPMIGIDLDKAGLRSPR